MQGRERGGDFIKGKFSKVRPIVAVAQTPFLRGGKVYQRLPGVEI